MNSQIKASASITIYSRPWVFKLRGWMMFLLGSLLIVMTAVKPEVMILSKDYSWLPLVAILLLLIGTLRCLDGIMSPRSSRFLLNLQGGIFDSVVGFLVLFSTGEDPVLLSLLVSGYLITQGIIRFALAFIVIKDNPWSTSIGGLLSLFFGFLVWMQWPSSEAWFLSLSLSIEIATRGWALVQFAKSLANKSD